MAEKLFRDANLITMQVNYVSESFSSELSRQEGYQIPLNVFNSPQTYLYIIESRRDKSCFILCEHDQQKWQISLPAF